ncbi:MAG: histidinol-phosphate transaminase [Paracoccaceae bacterium]
MTNLIRPQPGILDIAPYVGGKAGVAGATNVVKLSSNENPFGPSPKAKDAFLRAVHNLHRYPSTEHAELRAAIADVHRLDPARIICGVGSDEIIQMLASAYAGPRDEVVFTEHGFLMYRISALAVGATPVEVRERERVTDVDTILSACNMRTRLVFIANPNNPTGTMISPADVQRLAEGIPKQTLLVLDGAYAEYVEGFDAGLALLESRENVVMTRTFSKIYGLGGLRIGWGYGPAAVIDVLNRIRQPFNLSAAQTDAAEAAVRDQDYVVKCRTENARMRTWLASALAELGIPSDVSSANFILARFASPEEAQACDAFLQTEGLLVRQVAGYNLPNCLRITIGDESSCRRVAHAVARFKGTK